MQMSMPGLGRFLHSVLKLAIAYLSNTCHTSLNKTTMIYKFICLLTIEKYFMTMKTVVSS